MRMSVRAAAAAPSGIAGFAAETALATANTAESTAETAQATASAAGASAATALTTSKTALSAADRAQALAQTSVQYDNAAKTSVTLNPGGTAATVHNVA